MTILFEKTIMLVAIIAIGYMCSRFKLVSLEFNKGLSKIVLNIFLPAMILSSVINKEVPMTGSELISGFLMMIVMSLVCYGIGLLTPTILRIKDGDKGMYRMLAGFMNNGFFGFPLIAAVYGEGAVFFASLSNIPFNTLLYTFGILLLKDKDTKVDFRLKSILSAPLVATIIAALILIFKIHIPSIIADIVTTVGNGTVPLSMMCIGISLGAVPIYKAFTNLRLYGVSLVRLLLCPVAVWFILHFFITNPMILGIIVIISGCPSAAVCTMLGIENGRDGVESSEGIFLCSVLAALTIPLLMKVLGL